MNRVRLDQFNNNQFNPGSIASRTAWYAVSLVLFETAIPFPSALKRTVLRSFGADIGEGVIIKPRVHIKFPWKLEIGKHTWIGEKVWIDNLDLVHIGSHCCISQGAYLLCGNHDYTSQKFDLITKPITMEDGSWAGAKSMLGPGAILEAEAVLAVGSVGLGKLTGKKIHQGNPARPIRDRTINP